MCGAFNALTGKRLGMSIPKDRLLRRFFGGKIFFRADHRSQIYGSMGIQVFKLDCGQSLPQWL